MCTSATSSSKQVSSPTGDGSGGTGSAYISMSLTDVMRFRLDHNQCRFLLQRGPAEDVNALGWQVDDHTTFDEIMSRATATACR